MNKELILKSDVLDIIFENRNKAYGAYDLRKFYNNRLIRSLGLMLCGVVILSAFSFLPGKKSEAPKEDIIAVFGQIAPDPKKEEPKKKEPEKPREPVKPPAQTAPTQIYTKPVVVAVDIPVAPINNLSDSAFIGSKTDPGKPGNVLVVTPPLIPGDGPATPPEPVKPVVDQVTPTETPDVMPAYPGGMNALIKFLERNLHNPRDMEEGEMVTVRMRFVVGYDGKLRGFTILQDGGEEFNKEVMRVLKKMPDWVPGKTRGENVSVYYTIPVKFVPAE